MASSNKNPWNDFELGKRYREIRISQMNLLLPITFHFKLEHDVFKKLSGPELQRNNTPGNRKAKTAARKIGLDVVLIREGEKDIPVIIRWNSDPDIFYKAPSLMTEKETINYLIDHYWLILISPEKEKEFTKFCWISTKKILTIPGIHYEFQRIGNERRFVFSVNGKNLKLNTHSINGEIELFEKQPSFFEAITNTL